MKLKLALILAALTFIFVGSKAAQASEGIFELRNRVGEQARCVSYSVLMQDQNYEILVSCRDILYPGGTSVFSYVLWGVPTNGGNHFRLGTLGLGKESFKTKTPFSSLYVTKEPTSNPRTPTGTIVMQGNLQINELLDTPQSAPEVSELESPTPSPVATPGSRNLGRIFAAGGILAFIAIFGVILVIFVITRK